MLTYEHHTDTSPSSLLESNRKKRRRLDASGQSTSDAGIDNCQIVRWRSSLEHQTYSSKLIEALRQVRRRNSVPVSDSRAVRDAADKALAIAAKGRTRWSRAILANRLKLRLRSHKKAKKATARISPPQNTVTGSGNGRSIGGENKLPPLEKRVKVLGRLVPGCRKLSFPNLLEEATDYIAALQMQVRTMAALAQLLSGSPPSDAGPMDMEADIEPSGTGTESNRDDTPVH